VLEQRQLVGQCELRLGNTVRAISKAKVQGRYPLGLLWCLRGVPEDSLSREA